MIKIPRQTVIIKKGKITGKSTVIMCGVHGNEIAGVLAMNELVNKLKIDFGTVFFIYANPLAIKNNKRFIDKNMNRMFKNKKGGSSYEEIRVKEIKRYLDKSDFLLDIHSSNSKQSKPFLITEHIDFSGVFPVEFVVSGFEKIEPGGSDGYMDYIGAKGFCLESGSIKSTAGIILAKESIINFLRFTGNIDLNCTIYKNQHKINIDKLYKTKTNSFNLYKDFVDFESITKGQIIGVDGEDRIFAEGDTMILFARNRTKKGSEGFITLSTI